MAYVKRKPKRSYPRQNRDPKYKERQRFYSGKKWKELRNRYVKRVVLDEYEEARGNTVVGAILHHTKPRLEYPELAYDLDNLILVSAKTHGFMHEQLDKGLYYDKKTHTFRKL